MKRLEVYFFLRKVSAARARSGTEVAPLAHLSPLTRTSAHHFEGIFVISGESAPKSSFLTWVIGTGSANGADQRGAERQGLGEDVTGDNLITHRVPAKSLQLCVSLQRPHQYSRIRILGNLNI